MGNIGRVVRDESFNFESATFGDSVNSGIANVVSPASFVEGLSGQGLLV
ncbi:hypothetical protein [Streptomyces sp. 8N706]